MEYYAVVGMVALALIVIFGLLITLSSSVKKNIKDQQNPINELNISITELTYEIRAMRTSNEVRDKRLDKHGDEIDEISKVVSSNEQEIKEHKRRISKLEKKAGI